MANAIFTEFNSKKAAQAAARREYGANYANIVTIDEFDGRWYVTEYFNHRKETMVADQETKDVTVA